MLVVLVLVLGSVSISVLVEMALLFAVKLCVPVKGFAVRAMRIGLKDSELLLGLVAKLK
jgi:hypothetical protein